MEVLKDISQLTKGCGVTFIKMINSTTMSTSWYTLTMTRIIFLSITGHKKSFEYMSANF